MRSVLAHGILAVGGLVVAWLVWLDAQDPEKARDQVTVWECSKAEVQSVRYTDDKRKVRLEPRGQDGETVWWVELADKSDASTEQFVAGDRIEGYLSELSPLVAERQLGELDEEMLDKLELTKTDKELAIQCGGEKRTYLIGGRAYGAGDRYARRKSGGPVYLLPSSLVRDLRTAKSQLMQRELHTVEMREVETIFVRAYGKQRELLQRNRMHPRKAQWVDAAKPDQRNELYGNWLMRVHRLRVMDYLPPGTKPGDELAEGGAEVESLMTLVYRGPDGGELGRLELKRANTDPATYYARTEATRAWVTVTRSVAEQVQRDLRAVVGADLQSASPSQAQDAARE